MPSQGAVLACSALLALAGCLAASPADPAEESTTLGGPVVGAVGVSLMNGYSADEDHIGESPEVSWPTGDDPWSFASRMGAVARENEAVGGAHSSTFVKQTDQLQEATLVLVGFVDANVCAAVTVITADIPDGGTFEDHLRAGVRALQARGMQALLVTVPDFDSMARAARANPPMSEEVVSYAAGQQCGSEPGYHAKNDAMNALILRIAEEEGALHDNGAIAAIEWTPEMMSRADGFHPSPAGLEVMATVVWDAYVNQQGPGSMQDL